VDGTGRWILLPGRLTHVSASGNGYIWGVNKYDQIYKCKKPCSGSWEKVNGLLKQLDAGQGYVYGVNANKDIFSRPVDGSGAWKHIPGKLKHITGSGMYYVFGVNDNDQIYTGR